MKSTLGKKIDLLQAEKDITNVELANKMRIFPQNVAALKKRIRPRNSTIHKLAKALEVPVSIFFEL